MKNKANLLQGAIVAYVVALMGMVTLGILLFRNLYSAPAPTPGTDFAPSYSLFLNIGGGLIAICLVAVAVIVVSFTRKWWIGASALIAGFMLTIPALSVLPWIRFPYDQYAVGVTWAFFWVPVCIGLWILISGRNWIKRMAQPSGGLTFDSF